MVGRGFIEGQFCMNFVDHFRHKRHKFKLTYFFYIKSYLFEIRSQLECVRERGDTQFVNWSIVGKCGDL